jgi:regulator of RNase E activity RraB
MKEMFTVKGCYFHDNNGDDDDNDNDVDNDK